ncbi:hypothetical protein EVA_11529 [gut metagenome]|uniref:Tetratricopeptide repeat protein n=1 Tax=gut metagenome TaxID=749906 RepID=J9GEZ8_9ZZZZ
MSNTPESKLTPQYEKPENNPTILSRTTVIANANARTATEVLAEEMVHHNYFDVVMICDSALRAKDKIARESTLTQEEIHQLSTDLNADMLIAVEDLPFKVTKTIRYLPEFNCFQSTAEAKTSPVIRIYLPKLNRPMNTIVPTDSLMWQEFCSSPEEAASYLPNDNEILKEVSEYAGFIAARHLVPTWERATRVLYTNGSVPIRDAAVYVRENEWDKASRLWEQAFKESKSKKKKMKAAYNLAVYHEMKDRLSEAQQWAEKAHQLAKEIEKKNLLRTLQATFEEVPYYYITNNYLAELKKRNKDLPKLKVQMNRFKEDF